MPDLELMITDHHGQIAGWRNASMESLRTSRPTTAERQARWFKNLDLNQHRYWGVVKPHHGLVAFGGLTYIQWENGSAEISLIVDPKEREQGIGMESVRLLLHEGFHNMNLRVIYGEVYECNPSRRFWQKACEHWKAETAELPMRKYWDGQYWGSTYFAITRGEGQLIPSATGDNALAVCSICGDAFHRMRKIRSDAKAVLCPKPSCVRTAANERQRRHRASRSVKQES